MLGFFRRSQQESHEALTRVLGETEIPTFPSALMAILDSIRDPDNSMDKVAEQAVVDPGLVVRVLKTVNSAAYGLRRSVDSMHHACSLMGRSQLESLVLSLTIREVLPESPSPGFEARRFWTTAFRRASLARLLAARFNPSRQAECFTAGLLLDMAVPLLAGTQTPGYGQVLEHWHSDPDSDLAELENESFGWTHAQLGAALGCFWQLPEYLVSAIEEHHGHTTRPELGLAVDLVAHLREDDEHPGTEIVIESLEEAGGIPPEEAEQTIADAFGQAEELSCHFN